MVFLAILFGECDLGNHKTWSDNLALPLHVFVELETRYRTSTRAFAVSIAREVAIQLKYVNEWFKSHRWEMSAWSKSIQVSGPKHFQSPKCSYG
jgi:hypothetical protein